MEIFGVINASPDSLADFSVVSGYDEALSYGQKLLDDGADHLDLGGQASHGGAAFVSPDEEWEILREPLRALVELGHRRSNGQQPISISVDTWQVETAQLAFDAGANVLNAADALQDDAMMEFAAQRECQVVMPFMLGPDPRHLKHVEGDPVAVMVGWFDEQLRRVEKFGIRDRILLDPGTGFAPPHWDWSDRYEYQKLIYNGLDQLRRFELPIYVPVPWLQTSDRMELLDIVVAQDIEYARAHLPGQVRERHAAMNRPGTENTVAPQNDEEEIPRT